MSFITKEVYDSLYGEISGTEFDHLSFKANRILAEHTTGVDGFEKLIHATPTDEDTLTALKYCAAEIINTLHQIATIEKAGAMVSRADGTMAPAVVASVSSGSESITYSTNGSSTAVSAAVSDFKARTALFSGILRNYLSGMKDANGVNLLYMGAYPYV